MKISTATGADLDLWAAKSMGLMASIHEFAGQRTCFARGDVYEDAKPFRPSTDMADALRLVQGASLSLQKRGSIWECSIVGESASCAHGETPLIAMVRSMVIAKYGDMLVQRLSSDAHPLEHLIGRVRR